MHVPITRSRFPVADRQADGSLNEQLHPRQAAIRFLREKIADGRAGLDPLEHDGAIVVLVALPHEVVWAKNMLDLVGCVLDVADLDEGRRRYRAVLEADVRHELGLERGDAPLLDDPVPLPLRPIGGTVAEIRRSLTIADIPEVH